MPGTDGMTTVRRAWETMRDQQISTLPITDGDGNLMGIITLKIWPWPIWTFPARCFSRYPIPLIKNY